jgi:hypothetical protein
LQGALCEVIYYAQIGGPLLILSNSTELEFYPNPLAIKARGSF